MWMVGFGSCEWAFSFGGLRGLAGGFGREGWGINGDVCWARFLGCRNVVGMLRWEMWVAFCFMVLLLRGMGLGYSRGLSTRRERERFT